MGCWVAPSIAAEIWGVTLADVASLISSGGTSHAVQRVLQLHPPPALLRPPVSRSPRANDPPLTTASPPRPTPPPPPPEPEPTIAKIEPTPIIEEDPELGPPPDEDPNDNPHQRMACRPPSQFHAPPPTGCALALFDLDFVQPLRRIGILQLHRLQRPHEYVTDHVVCGTTYDRPGRRTTAHRASNISPARRCRRPCIQATTDGRANRRGLNFQFFDLSSSRAIMRCFCSFLEMCRKNFTMVVPSLASIASK